MKNKIYSLPDLPYGYNDLEPYISQEQLKIHHQKHHQAYVGGANAIFERLENSRKEDSELDIKSILKELSFNIGGHTLHSLFWQNLAPIAKGGGQLEKNIENVIKEEFKSFERFKKEFSKAAQSVEGSGWAVLVIDKDVNRPIIMQIEKHNSNIYPGFPILMVLDVFEHAYYIDYKNDRAKFIEAFWNIVNWEKVNERLNNIK